ADHDHCGDVRIAPGADQCAEMQVEVRAELQAPVWMRDRHHALDVVLDCLRRGIRQVVDRQYDHVVAHADPPVFAHVPSETRFRKVHSHHRFVLMFCTCACSPLAIGATTLPISTPYLITVSPGL